MKIFIKTTGRKGFKGGEMNEKEREREKGFRSIKPFTK